MMNIDDDAFVVASVGRLVDFKRFDALLDAVAQARSHIPHLRCLIVGDGPERDTLIERAGRPDLNGHVMFLGHREDIPDILVAADAFVLTSPVEGFGRVLIEAMASHLPVVAVDSGGPSEIVDDGVSGLLVEPGNVEGLAAAIERLHTSPELCARLAKAARRRVEERYSMAEHTRQVAALYHDLATHDGTF